METIPVNELVGSLQSYESGLPKTNKSKTMDLKSVDDVDESEFDDEMSSTEIAYLAKNEQPKSASSKKPNFGKDKVCQSSSNSLGQQCFECQGYGQVRSKCPT